jgi:hypothetical protein
MSKVNVTSLMVLCAALAACSDTATNRTVTAPDVRSALSEAPAGYSVGFTYDGPFDVAFGTDASSTQMAAAAQAASGGRASGHVGLNLPASPGVVSEKYSFAALSADPSTPFAAKGQYEMELTTATGRTNKVHGDIICMGITGNTARIGGQITKLWVNNVQVPIAGPTHNIWVVVDNGQGQAVPDQVSLMQYTIAPGAQAHCATGLPSVVFANQEGEVQVEP